MAEFPENVQAEIVVSVPGNGVADNNPPPWCCLQNMLLSKHVFGVRIASLIRASLGCQWSTVALLSEKMQADMVSKKPQVIRMPPPPICMSACTGGHAQLMLWVVTPLFVHACPEVLRAMRARDSKRTGLFFLKQAKKGVQFRPFHSPCRTATLRPCFRRM